MPGHDDVTLVQLALTGDRGAQRALASRLFDAIHREVLLATRRHATARGRDPRQDALDLVQEVLVALLERNGQELRRWDPSRGRNLESFVRLVARRRVARVLTQHRGNPWALMPSEAGRDDVDSEQVSRLEHHADLEAVLDGLYAAMDTRDAELFELLFVDELPSEEVGQRMGMSVGAVNAWRYRVRKLARRISQAPASSEVVAADKGSQADG
jgi:RNA polymerase sigma-70 factor (ECF subfamily)